MISHSDNLIPDAGAASASPDGGPLSQDKLYIRRSADDVLLRRLQGGDPCYVLAPRQIGKSSLLMHTYNELRAQGVLCAVITLEMIGTHGDADRWNYSFLRYLIEGFSEQIEWASAQSDLDSYWDSSAKFTPTVRMLDFFDNYILRRIPKRSVVLIDEVDGLTSPSLESVRCDFVAFLRSTVQRRIEKPEWSKLTFCLFGTAARDQLFRNAHKIPDFYGNEIRLEDFTEQEAERFQPLVPPSSADPVEVIHAVWKVTSGHPYMMQKLLGGLRQNRLLQSRTVNEAVDETLQTELLGPGVSDVILTNAEARIIRCSAVLDVLALYRKVLQATPPPLAEPDDLWRQELRLSGLVAERTTASKARVLDVRNHIFHSRFGMNWLRSREDVHTWVKQRQKWQENGERPEYLLDAADTQRMRERRNQSPQEFSTDDEHFLDASLKRQEELNNQHNQAELKLRDAALTQTQIKLDDAKDAQVRISRSMARYLSLAGLGLIVAMLAAVVWAAKSKRDEKRAKDALDREQVARKDEAAQRRIAEEKQQFAEAEARTAFLARVESGKQALLARNAELAAQAAYLQINQALDRARSKTAALMARSPDDHVEALGLGMVAGATAVRSGQVQSESTEGFVEAVHHLATPERPIDTRCEVAALALSPGNHRLFIAERPCPALTGGGLTLYGLAGATKLDPVTFAGPMGPPSDVSVLAFSAEGRYLAAGTQRGHALVWRADPRLGDRKPTSALQLSSAPIRALTFWPPPQSQLSSTLATLDQSQDRSKVLIAATADSVYTIDLEQALSERDLAASRSWPASRLEGGQVTGLAASPTAPLVIVMSDDGQLRPLRLDRPSEATLPAGIQAPSRRLASIAFSEDGSTFATAADAPQIDIWDAQLLRWRSSIQGPAAGVSSLRFSADSKHLISVGHDGISHVWDVENRGYLRILAERTGRTYLSAIGSDGQRVATVTPLPSRLGAGQRVLLWSTLCEGDGSAVCMDQQPSRLEAVALSPNGSLALAALENGTFVQYHLPYDPGSARQINTLSRSVSDSKSPLLHVRALAINPSHNQAVVGDIRGDLWWLQLDSAHRFQRERLPEQPHRGAIRSLEWSIDGRWLLSYSTDEVAVLWQLVDSRLVKRQIYVHRGGTRVPPLLIGGPSPAEPWTATLETPRRLQIWTRQQDSPLHTIDADSDVRSMALSKEGQRLVLGGSEGELTVYQTHTGLRASSFQRRHTGAVQFVAFAPSGDRLISMGEDGRAWLWSIHSSQPAVSLQDYRPTLRGAAFSAQGNLLVGFGANEKALVWNLSNGKLSIQLGAHGGPVRFAAFALNGHIVTAASTGKFQVHKAPVREYFVSGCTTHDAVSPAAMSIGISPKERQKLIHTCKQLPGIKAQRKAASLR